MKINEIDIQDSIQIRMHDSVTSCFEALCGNGWISDGNYCYSLSTTTLSWSAARSECQRVGADLVTIKSYTQSAFLVSKVSESHWIGVTDASVEGMNQHVFNTTRFNM